MARVLIVDADAVSRDALRGLLESLGHQVEADPRGDFGLPDCTAPVAALPDDWLRAELPAAIEHLERALITHALACSNGNRAEASRRLGIHRQLLYRKLAQYGIA